MPSTRLELLALPGFPMVQTGDDLAGMIIEAVSRNGVTLTSGDIVVLAQKVISKAEGRAIDLADVTPGPQAIDVAAEVQKDPRLVELILSQSRRIVRMRPGLLIVEHLLGWIIANAGVDQSNVGRSGPTEQAMLLPADPDRSAEVLRGRLEAHFKVRLAVVINDSFGRAWRYGTVGTAIGVAGLPALIDLRGKTDLFGRVLKTTMIGFADEVAAAASLLMGQADEAQPVVVVRGLHWSAPSLSASSLIRTQHEDLFR